MAHPLALSRLLQLSSVSLPVGGYAFSQGMEYAIECRWIKTFDDTEAWIRLQLAEGLAKVDLPILRGAMESTCEQDWQRLMFLNDISIASRETKELRLTDTAMGAALLRLITSLDFDLPECFKCEDEELSFVVLFAYAAQAWEISYQDAANGFVWSWLENQVAAATKLVPLGQTQAQQMLTLFQPVIGEIIALSGSVEEDNIGGGLPGLAIASALHEQQYSRLFRS
jgi:urease accessory protein